MPRALVPLAIALVLPFLGACRPATVEAASPVSTNTLGTPTVPAGTPTLPAGTPLKVVLAVDLSPVASREGDPVAAVLGESVIDSRANVILPAGTPMSGRVTRVTPDEVRIDFTALELPGRRQEIHTEITGGPGPGGDLPRGTLLILALKEPVSIT